MSTSKADQVAQAWDALEYALKHSTAKCGGDDRFVSDLSDVALLATVCATCPVFTECNDYATKAKPAGGVWAGRRFTQTTTRKAKP